MKLDLDQALISRARTAAASIADGVMAEIKPCTTVAVERSILRLLGVDGVDVDGVPLPNVVVDRMAEEGLLGLGAARVMARAMAATGDDVNTIAAKISRDEIELAELPTAGEAAGMAKISAIATKSVARIAANRNYREEFIAKHDEAPTPWLYVIVATGNIYEDVKQATAAAQAGADVIAVIRSTAQSLLDYVPYGATTEGFGGTYATQENFRIMRAALDEIGQELGRYIRLVNYASGLCMPEIAAMGALERLDMMLNDAMYGILFRDINMLRTLADQHFSRMINSAAGIIINTGEDNYLTTADAVEAAHTVLASQFVNEALALRSGLPEEQMGLGHAFEIDPAMEDSLLLEIAQAEMAREIFPKHPLKYMPPTKFMTGDIFRGHLMNGMFNLTGVLTDQHIQLLGILTEAIHTPFMQDRDLAIRNAKHVFNSARHLRSEIEFVKGGRIQRRAAEVLGLATNLLEEIAASGLMAAIEKGLFAEIKRPRDGGRGLEGVVRKASGYVNPFEELLQKEINARRVGQ
ncbi:MAG TPA: D-lysine 5,6-aminomutase subunit alpha [Firmicutes bacterium]|jgi:beta-lysine 5,6-aminomutase alpha subunit|nr:D-lysine 5,6-aminomutase subunit alpha [Bacillota bacterium]HBL50991.1 D-lysine 5,6-aminomutase subunit alpha [Bacillota bacterium]HBR24905.1 D-lysine 5,6-aminomutase subunit alpha [Bacillota bacterium]HCF88901.1 D-lysine 5,6-aminomutase subunit alpha [Bacillota bacterium]HCF92327.1 D-lysine 5,6-aminomutase subunit alpha [Bacillota bacterium]